jgi:hypothetical protein
MIGQKKASYENNFENQKRNLIRVNRSNKILDASILPVVLNLNPRSLYNKQSEFRTLVEQTDVGVCCLSESWDRSHVAGSRRIADVLNIDGYKWVQHVVQRTKKGGKPAILVNNNLFHIKDLCPELSQCQLVLRQCGPF